MRLKHAAITKGILAGIIFCGFLFITAQAADLVPFHDISPAQAQSESIVSAEKVLIRSAVLNEERELRVAMPSGYGQSQDAYPVLFVLDGDLNFAVTAEIARYLAAYRMIPPMIVVGVLNTERSRDMTHNQPVPAHARYTNAGGADRFLKFLAEEAVPEIEKRYRALPERTLVGHSLSGMLTVYALLTRPDLFSSYIAISPSLWWNDFELLAKVQAFYKSRPALKKKVFVSLADESEGDPTVYPRVKEAFERSAPKELAVFVQFFMNDNHISTAVTSITSALQKMFSTR